MRTADRVLSDDVGLKNKNFLSGGKRILSVFVFPLLLVSFDCLAAPMAARAEAPGIAITGVTITAESVNPNLLENGSFEDATPAGLPVGWDWDKRNTTATAQVDTAAHRGHGALLLTNQTPFGANVYGLLTYHQPIPLIAGQPYTLSAFVRSAAPGHVWIGGGAQWQYRLALPGDLIADHWRHIQMIFTPAPADTPFVLHIGTDSPTAGVWIDDVKLEAGTAATPDPPDGTMPSLDPAAATTPEDTTAGDGPWSLSFDLSAPHALHGDQLTAALTGALAVVANTPLDVAAGVWRVTVQGTAQAADATPQTVQVQIKNGPQTVAVGSQTIRFLSPLRAEQRLAVLRAQLPALEQLLQSVQSQGQDPSYPRVSVTVLQNFVGYVDDDLHSTEVPRAFDELGELEAMDARAERELHAALAGRRLPDVPRWTGTQRPRISGPSFLGPVVFLSRPNKPIIRPVFFVGYGHFDQVRRDIEKFPGYGTNIIQIEIGPSAVFPKDGVEADAPIQATRSVLDRAAKAGVAVDLLISPHYMPGWMLDKYPELRKQREGFLQYCLHAPAGQAFLRRYVQTIIPPLAGSPALHSICLSNEPINAEEPDAYAAQDWHDWLRKRDGAIAALNTRWGTHYAAFEDVPLPNPLAGGSPDIPRPSPIWAEFIRFNQEFFAGWHRMLAQAIHAEAPDLPVLAKPMAWTFLNEQAARFGVDAQLFGAMSDINGNDSAETYTYGNGEFAQDFQTSEEAYDLQRSVRDAPVFNSENHVINDRETRPVPPEQLRSLLWQDALHGQSATTIWVWERTTDRRSDFYGNIMHHPAAVEAVGRTALDLNRLAPEVTALQRAAPQVRLLQSVSAAVWDGPAYTDCLNKLYTALAFQGVPVGFVTERQLEAGNAPAAPLLLVPNITHLSDAACAALAHYSGRVVYVGDGRLTRDEYDRPRADAPSAASTLPFHYSSAAWQDLWAALPPVLASAHTASPVQIGDASDRPLWGVEWRCAQTASGLLVSLCNYRTTPVTLTLWRTGQVKAETGTDLLTGAALPPAATSAHPLRVTLQPLEVALYRFPK